MWFRRELVCSGRLMAVVAGFAEKERRFMGFHPRETDQMSYAPHHGPGFGHVPPQMKMDTARSPINYESFPCYGSYVCPYPLPYQGCYHNQVDIAYAPHFERVHVFIEDVWKHNVLSGRPKLAAWFEELNKIDAYTQTKVGPQEFITLYKKRFLVQK